MMKFVPDPFQHYFPSLWAEGHVDWPNLYSYHTIHWSFTDAIRTYAKVPLLVSKSLEKLPTDWIPHFFRPNSNFQSKCVLSWKYNLYLTIDFFQSLFIFKFKSYAPINEDFLALVCYSSVGVWTIFYGITFMVMPGKLGTNYYMCAGEDPRNDYYTTKKVKARSLQDTLQQHNDFHLRNRQ